MRGLAKINLKTALSFIFLLLISTSCKKEIAKTTPNPDKKIKTVAEYIEVMKNDNNFILMSKSFILYEQSLKEEKLANLGKVHTEKNNSEQAIGILPSPNEIKTRDELVNYSKKLGLSKPEQAVDLTFEFGTMYSKFLIANPGFAHLSIENRKIALFEALEYHIKMDNQSKFVLGRLRNNSGKIMLADSGPDGAQKWAFAISECDIAFHHQITAIWATADALMIINVFVSAGAGIPLIFIGAQLSSTAAMYAQNNCYDTASRNFFFNMHVE